MKLFNCSKLEADGEGGAMCTWDFAGIMFKIQRKGIAHFGNNFKT